MSKRQKGNSVKVHRFESVEQFVRDISDPTHPANQLKRPAKRVCRFCGAKYVSKVSVLCDDGVCSDACRKAEKAFCDEYLATDRKEIL